VIQALRDDPITIYGDGSQTRSFCYVDDLIEGFLRLMHSRDELQGPVNLGNPAEFSILELAEKVIDITGSKSRLEFRPLPSDDPRQRQPDIALARAELGWQPKVQLEEGLEKTIDYFDRLLKSSARVSKVDFARFDRRQHAGDRRRAERQDYKLVGDGKDRRTGVRDRRVGAAGSHVTAFAAAE
jgi:dTDP-D-glucose 4,6-dehydratase